MSKVRLGFIGAGWWATTNHLPILAQRDDVELVAVCSVHPDALVRIQQHFGFAMATIDYREVLDQELDGVVVTSPHSLHYEHTLAALERGYHVLCEKPMVLVPQQAWKLVATARERNRHLIVPYGWHYKPFLQTAKQWMEEGVVGTIEFVLCHMASPTLGLFAGNGEVPAQWAPTFATPSMSTWQVKEQGGGYAHGQITHSSALLFWLTGLSATRVTATMTAPEAAVDLYDAATVVYDNGAIGTVSGAATLPDDDKFQIDVRIFGSEGVLLLDVERERLDVRRRDGQHRHLQVPAGEGNYTCEGPPVRFVELIQGRGRNDSPGEIAARTVELINAMHRSAAQGGTPVSVERS